MTDAASIDSDNVFAMYREPTSASDARAVLGLFERRFGRAPHIIVTRDGVRPEWVGPEVEARKDGRVLKNTVWLS